MFNTLESTSCIAASSRRVNCIESNPSNYNKIISVYKYRLFLYNKHQNFRNPQIVTEKSTNSNRKISKILSFSFIRRKNDGGKIIIYKWYFP